MKITARIREENQSIVDALNKRGITAKLVKGGIIVELPAAKEKWDSPGDYLIPAETHYATISIDIAEEGGGATNTGSGTVVCGLNGKALRPYYIPRGGHLANGVHAYFSVPGGCVTITGYRRNNDITIEKHQIVSVGEISVVRIKSEKLWSGDIKELPNSFSQFQSAAQAANKKGNCYHCRCVHYATE